METLADLDNTPSGTFKIEAAHSVLSRLGDQMFGILRDELATYHNIMLSAGAEFTLEELDRALRELVGEGAAKWLMLEISAEIDFLGNEHLSKFENMVLTEQNVKP